MTTPRKTKRYKSVCQVRGVKDGKIKGYIIFTELTKRMKIEIDLYDLPPGPRGFHIHETGNLLKGCDSLCAHFNPTNKHHGDLNDKNAHAGDLPRYRGNACANWAIINGEDKVGLSIHKMDAGLDSGPIIQKK